MPTVAQLDRFLTALYRQIAGRLSESVAENLLRLGEVPITITEERIGTYEAPSLKIITPRGEAVHIVSRARIVVGAFGRITSARSFESQAGPTPSRSSVR